MNSTTQDHGKPSHDDSFEELYNDGESESGAEEEEEEVNMEIGGDPLRILHSPLHLPGGEIFLDLDTDNSDEDDYAFSFTDPDDFPLVGGVRGGGAMEENTDEMYSFSWALDGRRVGEQNPTNNRPSSPTAYMVSSREACVY